MFVVSSVLAAHGGLYVGSVTVPFFTGRDSLPTGMAPLPQQAGGNSGGPRFSAGELGAISGVPHFPPNPPSLGPPKVAYGRCQLATFEAEEGKPGDPVLLLANKFPIEPPAAGGPGNC